jgi:hypothetical protein
VRGAVVNDVTGTAEDGVQVILVPLNPVSGSPTAGYSAVVNSATGSFEIPRVVPGSYVLVAMARNRLMGRVFVDVQFADVDISLRTQTGVELAGRVVGNRQLSGGNAAQSLISLQPYPPLPPAFINSNVARAFQSAGTSPIAADGSFRLAGIPPGDYRVAVGPDIPLPNGYVKSIRVGNADALNAPLRIEKQSDEGIEITLGANTGTITGHVDSAGTVVLAPEANRAYRTDLFRTASPDATGQFRFDRIPPGDYKVFAWKEVEAGAWQDPKFLAPFESLGKVLHIDEGSVARIEVTSIDR